MNQRLNMEKLKRGASWELMWSGITFIFLGIALIVFTVFGFFNLGGTKSILALLGGLVLIFFGKGVFQRNWKKL